MTSHPHALGRRLTVGIPVPLKMFATVHGGIVDIAFDPRPTHIQFRRFAGCPVCSLHLRGFVRRRREMEQVVRELILFHSGKEMLLRHVDDLPFDLVADSDKQIYRAFGVETDPRALSDRRAWGTILRAVLVALPGALLGRKPLPPLAPEGGRFGLPADFLVAPDGRILACKYGEHVDDHWSVDEVLALANRFRASSEVADATAWTLTTTASSRSLE